MPMCDPIHARAVTMFVCNAVTVDVMIARRNFWNYHFDNRVTQNWEKGYILLPFGVPKWIETVNSSCKWATMKWWQVYSNCTPRQSKKCSPKQTALSSGGTQEGKTGTNKQTPMTLVPGVVNTRFGVSSLPTNLTKVSEVNYEIIYNSGTGIWHYHR